MWKENLPEDLETKEVEFELVEEFLLELKKEFVGGDEESVKVAELKRIEQRGKTMEEFVQEFRRAARGSKYQERALVEKFKRGINGGIRRNLIEAERLPSSIEKWYNHAINLDQHWKKSKRKKKRLRKRREGSNQGQRQ